MISRAVATFLVPVMLGAIGPAEKAAGSAAAEAVVAPVVAEAPVADLVAPVDDIRTPIEDIETETANGKATRVVIVSDILFDVDSAMLTTAAKKHIAAVAQRIPASAQRITVDGYTDSTGRVADNQRLSEDRAAAVASEMKKTVTDTSFSVLGHGEHDPVAPNLRGGKDDPRAMAKNRRVSIEYR